MKKTLPFHRKLSPPSPQTLAPKQCKYTQSKNPRSRIWILNQAFLFEFVARIYCNEEARSNGGQNWSSSSRSRPTVQRSATTTPLFRSSDGAFRAARLMVLLPAILCWRRGLRRGIVFAEQRANWRLGLVRILSDVGLFTAGFGGKKRWFSGRRFLERWRQKATLKKWLCWNVVEQIGDFISSRSNLSLHKPDFSITMKSSFAICYDLYAYTKRCWGFSTLTFSLFSSINPITNLSEYYYILIWVWGLVYATMRKHDDDMKNHKKAFKKVLVSEFLFSKEQDGSAHSHNDPMPTMVVETLKGGKMNKPVEAGSSGSMKGKNKRKTFLDKLSGVKENVLHLTSYRIAMCLDIGKHNQLRKGIFDLSEVPGIYDYMHVKLIEIQILPPILCLCLVYNRTYHVYRPDGLQFPFVKAHMQQDIAESNFICQRRILLKRTRIKDSKPRDHRGIGDKYDLVMTLVLKKLRLVCCSLTEYICMLICDHCTIIFSSCYWEVEDCGFRIEGISRKTNNTHKTHGLHSFKNNHPKDDYTHPRWEINLRSPRHWNISKDSQVIHLHEYSLDYIECWILGEKKRYLIILSNCRKSVLLVKRGMPLHVCGKEKRNVVNYRIWLVYKVNLYELKVHFDCCIGLACIDRHMKASLMEKQKRKRWRDYWNRQIDWEHRRLYSSEQARTQQHQQRRKKNKDTKRRQLKKNKEPRQMENMFLRNVMGVNIHSKEKMYSLRSILLVLLDFFTYIKKLIENIENIIENPKFSKCNHKLIINYPL